MSATNIFCDRARLERHPVAARVDTEERNRLCEDMGFGRVFTEHMVSINYTSEHGWRNGRIEALGPFSLHPATAVLHYAQVVFEGFKAYARADGSIATFRPYTHAARFNRSAQRLAMPEMSPERFVAAVDALVWEDRDWVPRNGENTLYIRPFMIATDPFLGVSPASTYEFRVIASPTASYFRTGVKPVSVWISEDYSRAAPGGTGAAKCAGNYAGSLIGQAQAIAHGCQQVVWLDSAERRYVEEMGGMNICFILRDGDRTQLVTPELSGTILEGVTRNSILTLARELDIDTVERKFSTDEWRSSAEQGLMTEAFACGTAATITPIGRVESAHGGWTIQDGQTGPVTQRLRTMLLDIQFGRANDPHDWMHPINPDRV